MGNYSKYNIDWSKVNVNYNFTLADINGMYKDVWLPLTPNNMVSLQEERKLEDDMERGNMAEAKSVIDKIRKM